MNILIAGASGFVGEALLLKLSNMQQYKIFALTRKPKRQLSKNIEWLTCDLFSLKDVEKVMKQKDICIYLVHSMLPSSGLVQGDFQDMDLILADNFARAARNASVKQIIYLGGIIPKAETQLSIHLKSRLETEETLGSYGTPLTCLRAPIIIGKAGSSFNIVVKLVERLPAMILPGWTNTFSCPVFLQDVVDSILFVIGGHYGKIYNLLGPDTITYRKLLELTAEVKGLKRFFFNVPFFTLQLSRLWVSLVTGTPKNLVYPLIQSLRHPMISDETTLVIPGGKFMGVKESIMEALNVKKIPQRKLVFPIFKKNEIFYHPSIEKKEVRSVQRLYRPPQKSAKWVMEKFFQWLPHFFKYFISVVINKNKINFILFQKITLLKMLYSQQRSTMDRQLIYIVGGILAKTNQGRARLEFRETTCGKYFLVAIHEFKPFLPWYLYRITQAPFHLWVMKKFGLFLESQEKLI